MSDQQLKDHVTQLESALAKEHDQRTWLVAMGRHQANRLWSDDFSPMHCIHPYTCGNDSKHANLVPLVINDECVVVCPDCDYKQPR